MPRLPHATDRGRETWRALRDALMALIREKGFDAVTIKEIAERAGVERTTFYLHASDKRELFEASQRQLMDELFAGGEGPFDLGELSRAGFRHIAEHASAYRVLLASADLATERRLHAYLAGTIERVVRTRSEVLDHRPEVPADLLAAYAASVLRGLAKWWLEREMPYPPDAMAQIFQRLLQGGLSAYMGVT